MASSSSSPARTRIFFEARANEFFNLSAPEDVAGMKANRENFAEIWNDSFPQVQNKIPQTGVSLGLLPNAGNLNDLWVK